MTEPQTHFLKCLAPYFDAVERGEKPFEVRKNDRGFQPGDIVVLVRTVGDCSKDEQAMWRAQHPKETFQPPQLRRRIGWLLQGGQFGIEPGYCVFALEPAGGASASNQTAALAGAIIPPTQSPEEGR